MIFVFTCCYTLFAGILAAFDVSEKGLIYALHNAYSDFRINFIKN